MYIHAWLIINAYTCTYMHVQIHTQDDLLCISRMRIWAIWRFYLFQPRLCEPRKSGFCCGLNILTNNLAYTDYINYIIRLYNHIVDYINYIGPILTYNNLKYTDKILLVMNQTEICLVLHQKKVVRSSTIF